MRRGSSTNRKAQAQPVSEPATLKLVAGGIWGIQRLECAVNWMYHGRGKRHEPQTLAAEAPRKQQHKKKGSTKCGPAAVWPSPRIRILYPTLKISDGMQHPVYTNNMSRRTRRVTGCQVQTMRGNMLVPPPRVLGSSTQSDR